MNWGDRQAMVRQWNADSAHQQMAGLASWAAFSARWRARQGLPLLHPMDVQYLTPQDFRNGRGEPFSPTVQRRIFREYVTAAVRLAAGGMVGRRRGGLVSADIALVRSDGFVRRLGLQHQDFQYGREDVGPYEPRALSPVRPYGVPVASASCVSYWLDGLVVGSAEGEDVGDDAWIAAWSASDVRP
jgi:hypothetical protein